MRHRGVRSVGRNPGILAVWWPEGFCAELELGGPRGLCFVSGFWASTMRPVAFEDGTSPSVRLETNPGKGNRLTVQSHDGGVDRYDISFRACPSPVCRCESIDLVCTPLDESTAGDSGPRIIALDIHGRGPQRSLHIIDQIDIPLTRNVAAGLSFPIRRLRRFH